MDLVYSDDDDNVVQASLFGRDQDLVAFLAYAYFSKVCAVLNSYDRSELLDSVQPTTVSSRAQLRLKTHTADVDVVIRIFTSS